jgi:isopenicillin-N N-acyltransferase-like protein
LILDHPNVDEPSWLRDSTKRLARVQELADVATRISGQDFEKLLALLSDEEGYPCSINRKQEGESGSETLFTIIMNLSRKYAMVRFGRPSEKGEEVRLVL